MQLWRVYDKIYNCLRKASLAEKNCTPPKKVTHIFFPFSISGLFAKIEPRFLFGLILLVYTLPCFTLYNPLYAFVRVNMERRLWNRGMNTELMFNVRDVLSKPVG